MDTKLDLLKTCTLKQTATATNSGLESNKASCTQALNGPQDFCLPSVLTEMNNTDLNKLCCSH